MQELFMVAILARPVKRSYENLASLRVRIESLPATPVNYTAAW